LALLLLPLPLHLEPVQGADAGKSMSSLPLPSFSPTLFATGHGLTPTPSAGTEPVLGRIADTLVVD